MMKESPTMDKEKKVLIVEDETLTAMMLESYMEEKGYISAGLSATGEDAVLKAKAEEPDLIFMDFRLSGEMDGIEAAKLISMASQTPIVIMSGYTESIVFERASGYRPTAFISKPVDFSEIDDILKSIA
jgi:CheY-like chemotaxis protein